MRPRNDPSAAHAAAAAAVLWLTSAASAGAPVAPEAPAARAQASDVSGSLELDVPDVPVVTQDGAHLNFHRDLVAGKVVAINFIFTTCTTVCPPLGVKFGTLQRLLGDHLGKDAFLISVSVDPVNDTPDRLKAWAAKFGARPGWTLVTGRKQDIDELLRGLSSSGASPEGHTPMVLIGNDAAGSWTRAHGFAPASTLVKSIEKALAATAVTVAGAGGSR
jgi:protein SCO1